MKASNPFEEISALAVEKAETEVSLINLRADNLTQRKRLKAIFDEARIALARLDSEEDNLVEKIQSIEEEISALMEDLDVSDLDLPVAREGKPALLYSVRRVNKGGVLPLIIDEKYAKDPAELPEEFHKREIVADKEAIRAALEKGAELSFARLGKRKFKIEVKVSGGAE